MQYNTIYCQDNLDGMKELPDKCANLIIADPPYFEIKGDFDFIWGSFDEYLKFMEEQAKAYKRILADNGTLFVYGHSKRIAYIQVIFDKYFSMINNLVWEKAERDGLFGSTGNKSLRCFPNSTERLLMYEHKEALGSPVGQYIRYTREAACLTRNDVDVALGYVRTKNPKRGTELCRRWEEGSSIPTEIDFDKVNVLCGGDGIFSDLVRCFNNATKSTEVLKFRFKPSKHEHDTVKPDSLCNAIVVACSSEGDLVVVPFAGSGSECVASKKHGREFVAFDVEQKYVDMATERVKKETAQLPLF